VTDAIRRGRFPVVGSAVSGFLRRPGVRFGLFCELRYAPADLGLRMNLPNALTLARIFLVPLLVVVLLTKFEGRLIFGVRKELIGAAIFGIASLTDWLDGYLARRRKQITTLGQLMDPLADKLLITAALVSLVQMDLAPAWMVAVILGREFAVTVLRSIAHARGVVIAASPLGKFKMASQVIAILLLILGRDHLQQFFVLGRVALWIAVVTAVASGMDYYRRFNHVLTGSRKPEVMVVPAVQPAGPGIDVADVRNRDRPGKG
jgi:CDP-diacylglycerol--glycerol-3-phosphate 3-phosphatidyltransferase